MSILCITSIQYSIHIYNTYTIYTYYIHVYTYITVLMLSCSHAHVQLLNHVQLFATHRLQPASLLCPWDFPGKNTGVGCHFLPRGSSPVSSQTHISCTSCIVRWILYHCAIWNPHTSYTHIHNIHVQHIEYTHKMQDAYRQCVYVSQISLIQGKRMVFLKCKNKYMKSYKSYSEITFHAFNFINLCLCIEK